MNTYKLGSLFDGSGGFPLAGALCGIIPVWAAEIEPYPIAVTRSRFPNMKHLGDISKINGAEIEPVDIITFGSPCQDLSVAGKRAGLKHTENGDDETTRSGLFMEAVRIIKEMREATNGQYPRWALWENVPGAFSSNKGEDFRVVCEELIKVVEPDAVMPAVPKGGWAYADSYRGTGWSLAYRVLDAQYWGVPQRRRRIYLVADFDGECAREVLFEREGLRGYFAESGAQGQRVAGDAQNCVGTDDREGEIPYCLEPGIAAREGGHIYDGVSGTLRANAGDNQMAVAYSLDPLSSNSMKSKNPHSGCRQVDVARTIDTTDPNPSKNQGGIAIVEQKVYAVDQGGGKSGANVSEDIAPTLTCTHGGEPVIALVDSIGGQAERGWVGEVAPCLKASHYKFPPCVAVTAAGFCPEESAKTRGVGYVEEQAPTLRVGVVPAVCAVYDARGNGDGAICNTITGDHNNRITDYSTVVCCCIDGDKIGKAERSGGSGPGIRDGDKTYTLTAKDAGTHGVAYAMQAFGKYAESDHASALKARDYKDATDLVVECADEAPISIDRAFFDQGQNDQFDPQYYTDGRVPTLVAKGPSAVCHKQEARYIVRRLTPTECARLQGFPDEWGHPDAKSDFSDEEYRFWIDVRNTHAAINGKAVKDYTKAQMLTWYNKLHTDSSEYKMWGNGIALPTALYVMQGIAERMKENV